MQYEERRREREMSRRGAGKEGGASKDIANAAYGGFGFAGMAATVDFAKHAGDTMKASAISSYWLADSCASQHMCNDKFLFSALTPLPAFATINTAGGTSIFATHIGSMRMILPASKWQTSYSVTVPDVWYVPDLRQNLFSIGQASEQGYSIYFQHGRMQWKDDKSGDLLMDVPSNSRLYAFRPSFLKEEAQGLYADSGSQSMQRWHERCLHVNEADLLRLIKDERVTGVATSGEKHLTDCKACIRGKMKAGPHPRQADKRSRPFERI